MVAIDRIAELCAQGEREMAETLAREVLKNDDLVDISIEGGEVIVETDMFIGTHAVEEGPDRPTMHEQGEYELKRDDVQLVITTHQTDDEVERKARELLPDGDGTNSEPFMVRSQGR